MAELVAGAVLGAAVAELLKSVISVAKMASRCEENCKRLLVTLNSISPLLDDAIKFATNGNVSCQAWLQSFHDLLRDAKIIVEACSMKKWHDRINYMKRTKLSCKIIAIDNQIRKKLVECNLVTLCIVLSNENNNMLQPSALNSMMPSISDTIMQDIPSMTVPFVENPFEKLKTKILNGGNAMGVPMTIGLKGRGGCGKTLLAKMVNNDEDIQRKYKKGGILWITVGRDATLSSLYSTMAKLLHDGGTYERDYIDRNFEDRRSYLIQVFQKRKVLLILDDVWGHHPTNNRAMIEWLDVAKGPGSITLVTTRDVSVLRCVKCIDVVDVQSLSKEDSWELFCMHAFVSKRPPSLPIEAIAKAICDQCDGLPLAIKVIGSAMWEKVAERKWYNLLKYLEGTSPINETIFTCFPMVGNVSNTFPT